MNDITPRDATETKALGIGQRISAAIGILIAMGSALLAAFGDMNWITDNLGLLGTGVGALVTGGLTSYVAIRRMSIDKTKIPAVLCLLCSILVLSGCGTTTRCQTIKANTVNITVNCNDPESISENAYPRSLAILSQDQQVEGGTDSIASGNSTPVSTLPMGDKAVDAVASLGTSYLSNLAAQAAAKAAEATKTAAQLKAASEAAAAATPAP